VQVEESFDQNVVRARRLAALCVVVATVVVCGCGSAAPEGKSIGKLVPVKGRASFLDKPMPQAIVTLHPVASDNKPVHTPFGVVGENGEFLLTTVRPEDGAPPGEYLATVTWIKRAPGTSADDGIGEELLPARYQRKETSGLKVTIKADAPEPIDLKLVR
jgi:hypothetical protein